MGEATSPTLPTLKNKVIGRGNQAGMHMAKNHKVATIYTRCVFCSSKF